MYIFGPPGWSPDGSTQTVRQMQRELRRQKKEHSDIPVATLEERILTRNNLNPDIRDNEIKLDQEFSKKLAG